MDGRKDEKKRTDADGRTEERPGEGIQEQIDVEESDMEQGYCIGKHNTIKRDIFLKGTTHAKLKDGRQKGRKFLGELPSIE